jgi:hypothetical protein
MKGDVRKQELGKIGIMSAIPFVPFLCSVVTNDLFVLIVIKQSNL